MAALDFPASPTVGDTYTANGKTWTWNGTAWTSGTSSLPLAVPYGGTGATTLTSGYVLKGNGTSAVSASVVYDNGTNIGIGTTNISPYAGYRTLAVGSTTGGALDFTSSSVGVNYNRVAQISGTNGGTLAFATGAGDTLSERMRITPTGNLGLGVTPSNWSGYGLPIMELPNNGTIVSAGSGNYLGANWYYNSGFKYKDTDYASYYQQISGQHRWYTAPAGTAGNAITFTQAMTLDASGNLGLGVTPSGWSAIKAIQTGLAASFSGGAAFNDAFVTSNAYYDGTNWKYINSNAAYYGSVGGTAAARWYTAASGTAGANITWTQAMTLDTSGNLIVGKASGSGARIEAYNAGSGDAVVRIGNAQNAFVTDVGKQGSTTYGATAAGDGFLYSSTNLSIMADNASGVIKFAAGGNGEKMRLDASGNLGLGVTPSAWGSGRSAIETGALGYIASTGSQMNMMQNSYFNGTNFIYKTTAAAAQYQQASGAHYWYITASGTAGATISWTQAMTLDTSGNLLVGATSAAFGNGSGTIVERAGVATLRVNNSSATVATEITSDATGSLISARGSFPIRFDQAGTERMRIHASGGVSIGNTTDPGAGDLLVSGSILSNAAGGIGYTTGAGGTISQTGGGSNKTTAVTLNTMTGTITMQNTALNAATIVSFTLTNSNIATTDILLIQHVSGGTSGAYTVNAFPGAGSAVISVRNNTAGSLSEALVLRFAVIKSANT